MLLGFWVCFPGRDVFYLPLKHKRPWEWHVVGALFVHPSALIPIRTTVPLRLAPLSPPIKPTSVQGNWPSAKPAGLLERPHQQFPLSTIHTAGAFSSASRWSPEGSIGSSALPLRAPPVPAALGSAPLLDTLAAQRVPQPSRAVASCVRWASVSCNENGSSNCLAHGDPIQVLRTVPGT